MPASPKKKCKPGYKKVGKICRRKSLLKKPVKRKSFNRSPKRHSPIPNQDIIEWNKPERKPLQALPFNQEIKAEKPRRTLVPLYVSQGGEGCIIILQEENETVEVFKIGKTSPQGRDINWQSSFDNLKEIMSAVRKIDPLQLRFVTSDSINVIGTPLFKAMNPEIYREYVKCQEKDFENFRIPDKLLVERMIPLIDFHDMYYKRPFPFPEGQWEFMKNYILESVNILHANGIVHCDIHKGNIMLRKIDGVYFPVLIDWGLAKFLKNVEAEKKGKLRTKEQMQLKLINDDIKLIKQHFV